MIKLTFDSQGLIPAVVQHAATKQVLMVGWMNQPAFDLTLQTKKVHFWSRSRQTLWLKGETSHHYLNLVSLFVDCDHDTLLVLALPEGPTCHTGAVSCFYERLYPVNDPQKEGDSHSEGFHESTP